MTIATLLEERAAERPEQPYLLWKDHQLSYGQLRDVADAVGRRLLSLGLVPGDRVAIHLPNCAEFVHVFFGAMRAGLVAVPMNSQLKERELKYILQNSEARACISVWPLVNMVRNVRGELPALKTIVISGTCPVPRDAWAQELGEGLLPYDDFLPGPGFVPAPPAPLDASAEAAIIYTSGTTGNPKGVVLTHHNYGTNLRQLIRAADIKPEDRFLCVLPLFHVNAQVVTLLAPLGAGASVVLLEKFSPVEFLEAIHKYQVTTFSAVPTIYAILNNRLDLGKYDLSHLRFCICGAAPMPVEVFETFEKKFKARIVEGYGLSEGTCASSVNPVDGVRKVGSIGVPLEGQEMRIVDDHGVPVAPGVTGEIVVRGENVMKGYFKDPAASEAALREGWLHTGDLGHVDSDGYFWIAGRKKEMIIRGGENIYPKEIEDVLYAHPRVAEAAVVGLPDPVWGEEVGAFIVLREKTKLTHQHLLSDEVISFLKERLADYKLPRKVFFRDNLPRTATGKVQKHVLKASVSGESGDVKG